MMDLREKRHGASVFARILALAVTLSFCQLAQGAPTLWEGSYFINATVLDGSNGGATGGAPPSGSFSGGTENIALGFNFPFGGVTYSRIVVDSDGAILLTNSAGEVSNVLPTIWKSDVIQPGFTNFGSGSPRPLIVPFGTALGQFNSAGKTYFKAFNGVFNGFSGQRAVITWENSSMNGSAGLTLTFQAQLLDDGTIIFGYISGSAIANWVNAPQGIVVGVSNGDGPALNGSQDFSVGTSGIDLTGYQIWCQNEDPANPTSCAQAGLGRNSAFDLDNRSVVFNPDGATGFLVGSTIQDGTGNGGSGVCPVSNEDAPGGPILWDNSYNALELDGNNGGATGGAPPSGTFSGGTENIALGFNFPFGGVMYSHIVVDSDGGILLTNSAAEVSNVLPTIWKSDYFLSGFTNFGSGSTRPVLLPFGTALGQFQSSGKTYFKSVNDSFGGFNGDRAVITWENSSLDGSSTRDLSFQAHLMDDGTIVFSYKTKSSIGQWDTRAPQGIVVGISDGAGDFPAGSKNFSFYDFGIDLTGYQIWCRNDKDPDDLLICAQSGLEGNDGFDLDDRSVVFNPDGNGAFLISSSIKNGSGKGGSDVCGNPPPPMAPVAVNDAIVAEEDKKFTSTVSLIANDTDANGDPLKATSGTFTTVHGGEIVIQNNGSYTYKPVKDFSGADSYLYTVKEINGSLSDTGTLNITVTPVNDAPVAQDDSAETTPNMPFNSVAQLDSNDSDVDGPALTVVAGTFTTVKGGEIVIASNGNYSYTPPVNFAGTDNIDYTVTDGLATDSGNLEITVTSEAIDITTSVLNAANKLQKNKAIKNHKKSKKYLKKARKHLESALEFLKMSDEINGEAEIENSIADLGKVKKKKSSVSDLISDLESIP